MTIISGGNLSSFDLPMPASEIVHLSEVGLMTLQASKLIFGGWRSGIIDLSRDWLSMTLSSRTSEYFVGEFAILCDGSMWPRV